MGTVVISNIIQNYLNKLKKETNISAQIYCLLQVKFRLLGFDLIHKMCFVSQIWLQIPQPLSMCCCSFI